MTIEEIAVIAWALAIGAQLFSWVTFMTENWWFFILTVLFAIGNLYFVAQALFW